MEVTWQASQTRKLNKIKQNEMNTNWCHSEVWRQEQRTILVLFAINFICS